MTDCKAEYGDGWGDGYGNGVSSWGDGYGWGRCNGNGYGNGGGSWGDGDGFSSGSGNGYGNGSICNIQKFLIFRKENSINRCREATARMAKPKNRTRDYRINRFIRQWLYRHDKKSAAVADKADIDRSVFSRIINDRRAIYPDELFHIIDALGIPLSDIAALFKEDSQ